MHHTAVLLTRSDARKQTEMGENVALAGPVSQDTTVTGQTGQPGPSSTAVDSLPPTRTGAMRGILVTFSSIGSYTRAMTTLIMRAKKDEVGPTLIKLRLWWETLKQSQFIFPPEKVKQQVPILVRGVLGTRNRLGKIKIFFYHKLPTSVLPLVSAKDIELIKMSMGWIPI